MGGRSDFRQKSGRTDWQSRRTQLFCWSHRNNGASGIVAVVRDDTDQRLAHLVGMWVDPRIRGTGAADDLVDRVIRWATDNDVPTLRLHVTEGNGRAERLYLRHGFGRTGSTFNRERDGATEVEMERAMETS
jgi:ribosomal protein S18 acetylase RimI-like enzyme